MSLWKLVKKSIGFYWRTNVGVFLAVLVSAAVLTGGLLVGDSVRYSLRRLVTARLGQVERAIVGGERFFRRQLADDLSRKFRKAGAAVDSAAVLSLRGLIADSEGARRVNQVEVLGVDERS